MRLYLLPYIAGLFFFLNSLTDGKKVMMEYIGGTGAPVTFDAVPIYDDIDFHFILSFAIDANTTGESQNGVFFPYWAPNLNSEAVAAIKQQHPNVRVLASLSGWGLGNTVLRWYNPPDPEVWIDNAIISLQTIVTTFHLDGIDVDYETFPKHHSTFAFCIGELLSRLKKEGVISITSIAPYYKTVGPYMELYGSYGGVIDYVNHQFYTDKVRRPKGYAEAFKVRAGQFDARKLLPSYEVDGRGIQGDAFFVALGLIEKDGFEVNGVMIWSADRSSSHGYYLERKSQEFLLNSTGSH